MNDLLGNSSSVKYGAAAYDAPDELEDGNQVAAVDANLQQFYRELEDIQSSMEEIQKKLRNLQDANEEGKTITRTDKLKNLKKSMEKDINHVLKIAKDIKGKIERLDRANEESRRQQGCGEGTATDRTRMSATATVKKKLQKLMNEFQDLRARFNDEYRETVERRYYTIYGKHPDPETLEHLIDTGESESIFANAIQEQGRGQVLDTIKEIEERHNAVKDIEKQLVELHQIFMDMAVLVESQGELIDNIEVQVGAAVDHVSTATKTLEVARKTQINTRKWICCGVILLIIIVVVIVVIVIKPWEAAK